jgi:hypothetical protein
VDDRAGQRAGDPVDALHVGDDQLAELVDVAPVTSSASVTPEISAMAFATSAALPTSVWMSTYA